MMVCSSAVFALPAAADLPRHLPSQASVLAPVTLGLVNTGLLSWVYFALVREAGAAVTSLITYVVPVVALVLGVSLLGEFLTIGAIVGLVFIALGTWLATSTQQPRLDHHRDSSENLRSPAAGPAGYSHTTHTRPTQRAEVHRQGWRVWPRPHRE
jgi:drug/metabolite transporter (DMT)-like permease